LPRGLLGEDRNQLRSRLLECGDVPGCCQPQPVPGSRRGRQSDRLRSKVGKRIPSGFGIFWRERPLENPGRSSFPFKAVQQSVATALDDQPPLRTRSIDAHRRRKACEGHNASLYSRIRRTFAKSLPILRLYKAEKAVQSDLKRYPNSTAATFT